MIHLNMHIKLFLKSILLLLLISSCEAGYEYPPNIPELPSDTTARTYYIDSRFGDDRNRGTSESTPWKSLEMIRERDFRPGDTIRFRRGSGFTGPLFVTSSGQPGKYITFTDYGDPKAAAPAFTNPVFEQDNFGNCIRVQASYVIIENLYFHNTAAFVIGNSYESDGGWIVWEMGAVYIDKGAEHCIVRNNEMFDCVAAIRSYGEHALIENNYIHDCNRPLREWNWGPLGIWLGGDYQTVRNNVIINMQVNDPDPTHFVNGVGGGAIEIDDGRYPKSNIILSYNYTRDNCGFLETVFNDVQPDPEYTHWQITHNVSDDYQAFVKLRFAKACKVENNTIIRRKVNATDHGVFVFKGNNTKNQVRNNIIITEQNVKIFNTSGNYAPATIIQNNLYHSVDTMVMGDDGPGAPAYYGNPKFYNYNGTTAADYNIISGSPAIDRGQDLGYGFDMINQAIPNGSGPDIGAFEYYP
ncbi:MAG: choice-of-anchor Q domain-containing protein [Bacteroidales bacterium]